MITISAHVKSSEGEHQVIMTTNGKGQSIDIPPKPGGFGSNVNGGELLFLALATCYCNDLYREAAKRNIAVRNVQVQCQGTFGDAPGSGAENIIYKAIVEAEASEEDILELMRYTDTVAEIQNTLRRGMTVTLIAVEAIPV